MLICRSCGAARIAKDVIADAPGFLKKTVPLISEFWKSAASIKKCSIIQGCRICNYMEEKSNSSYRLLTLNASILMSKSAAQNARIGIKHKPNSLIFTHTRIHLLHIPLCSECIQAVISVI